MKRSLPPWADALLAGAIRSAITLPHLLGLSRSLRIADAIGAAYPRLQPSRFERALANLKVAFPHLEEDQRRALATEAYKHLFRLGIEVVLSQRLITPESYLRHLHVDPMGDAFARLLSRGHPTLMITGHIGNWELIGSAMSVAGFPVHAVYRPLDVRALDRWLNESRSRRGLTLVNKFGAMKSLEPTLRAGVPIGLVADQSGGDRGMFVPYFGRLTSTYKSVGLLAMKTGARVVCGMARRRRAPDPDPVNPGLNYSIDLIDDFGPDDWETQPDPLFYITARYRRAFETMVRRAPEQYFWMHRLWRARPPHERRGEPFPRELREKIASLPWMTPDDVEAVVDRSNLDQQEVRLAR